MGQRPRPLGSPAQHPRHGRQPDQPEGSLPQVDPRHVHRHQGSAPGEARRAVPERAGEVPGDEPRGGSRMEKEPRREASHG